MDRLVKPGGLIVVDDMWMPGVRLAVAYVERNLDLGWSATRSRAPSAGAANRSYATASRGQRRNGRAANAEGPAAELGWDRFDEFF